jgi:hypothetical protein
MPLEAAGTLNSGRQEPGCTLSARLRLGALPRAARIAVGMALPEGSVTSRFPVCSRSVPSLFPVSKPEGAGRARLFPVFRFLS